MHPFGHRPSAPAERRGEAGAFVPASRGRRALAGARDSWVQSAMTCRDGPRRLFDLVQIIGPAAAVRPVEAFLAGAGVTATLVIHPYASGQGLVAIPCITVETRSSTKPGGTSGT